jgi:hypothetical protein
MKKGPHVLVVAATVFLSATVLSRAEDSPDLETETLSIEALSEEDQNASPFPPGPHAALVKKVCTECHLAQVVLNMRFTPDEAVRFYKVMVSSNIETDQAKRVIEYLSTTLGR